MEVLREFGEGGWEMETHSRFRRPGRLLVACGVAAAGLALTSLPAGAASVPGSPTITGVKVGIRSARVSFAPPASNGGAKGSHEGPKSPITVSGLTAGKTYTCVVQARNKVGLGAASAASDPVVPKGH